MVGPLRTSGIPLDHWGTSLRMYKSPVPQSVSGCSAAWSSPPTSTMWCDAIDLENIIGRKQMLVSCTWTSRAVSPFSLLNILPRVFYYSHGKQAKKVRSWLLKENKQGGAFPWNMNYSLELFTMFFFKFLGNNDHISFKLWWKCDV